MQQQQNNFSLGCNYSNRNSITGWSLWPVQDIDTRLLNNRHRMNPYANVDLYLRRQLKDTLKHTMLVQESVFESQVHELHRLYRRQKELMMERALYFDSSLHWMIPNVARHQTSSNYPYEVSIPNRVEAAYNVKNTQKKLSEYNGRVEEKGSNFLKEQSMEVESSEQLYKLHFDLNEPANEIGEDSAKEYDIDLNMPPLSSVEEEEIAIVKKVENEKPLSVSFHGLEQQRVLVQALPCLDSFLLLEKQYKPGRRKKKLKSGPSSAKPLKGDSNLSPHLSQGKKKRCCRPSNGKKVVVGKKKQKKSRKISLVTSEGNNREIYAVEAILDMSRKSGEETSDDRGLLWLAEISSLVVAEDSFEAVTLQVTEMELKKQNKTAVSNIVHRKQRRSRVRQVKRKFKDDQDSDNPSLATFSESESEADEDQQVIGKLSEPSESKRRFHNKDSKSSKRIGSHTASVEEEMVVDWGVIKKRKRGSRSPAASFQHLIINQLVL